MKEIYRYRQSFGRMGELESVFVSDAATVAKMKERGEISLGEVLGKHSDIKATINDETLTALSDDPVIVAFFEKELGGCVGIDLIDRWSELAGT